ncbi:TatD family hydrolase [Patiriisocius marinus]|uniref:TatD family hydrolase n=2 Tax=Patiriisocius marinus TaxID=1397112 RepID=A0A5J4IXT5_9FLAO|nr:TatD family hydrolase [Patiriisocius marinus]
MLSIALAFLTKIANKIPSFAAMLTDTHTHLYSESFDEDREIMMQRALDAGVKRFFIPAIDSNYAEAMFDLEKAYPDNVHLMMGLHPTSVKENYKEELQFVTSQFKCRNFIGVGEIGIDLYWDKSTLGIQQEAFRYQIQLAKKYKLPIVIHCRDAFDEVFEVLESEKSPKLFGIFHCFTGTLEQAHKAISYNMKLGIGGVVTFKNGKIDTFLNQIPLSEIVLETDSPYLSPVPYRGKRNESSYLALICKKVAEIYSISEEKVAEITTQNSKDIFSI